MDRVRGGRGDRLIRLSRAGALEFFRASGVGVVLKGWVWERIDG